MSRIRIVKRTMNILPEYQVGDLFEITGTGMEASILWENQVRLFLWIKRNM